MTRSQDFFCTGTGGAIQQGENALRAFWRGDDKKKKKKSQKWYKDISQNFELQNLFLAKRNVCILNFEDNNGNVTI